jgi:diguanylate cyclase (GGDEF)-like protein/PAS domain S-box-containing protein
MEPDMKATQPQPIEKETPGIPSGPQREPLSPSVAVKERNQATVIKRLGWMVLTAWTVSLAASLIWNLIEIRSDTRALALVGLQISFEKDVVYRRWAAEHGGVYVPVTDQTPPNPYLSHIPERDIETPSKRPLTLVNPAYMTRQVNELGKKQYGARGHITSLNPLRPENAPDEWEKESLKQFMKGVKEVTAVVNLDGEPYLRLMRPFLTEKGCLKCHAHQGYRVGDIRGGISVSSPMKPYQALMHSRQLALTIGHILLWLLGLGGIGLMTRRLITADRLRSEVQEEIRATLYGIGDGVIAADTGGRVVRVNPVAEQLTGWSEIEALGRPLAEVFRILNEENRAEAVSPVDRALREGKIVGLANDTLLIARDGTERPIADSCAPIRNEIGRITGAVLIFRDQTAERAAQKALQDSEEKYRVIFENAVEGIYQTTPEGHYISANPALARMIGYDSPEDLIREISDLSKQGYVNPDDRIRFKKILEEQGVIYGFETQHYKKDGSKFWVLINARAVKDEAGKVLYYEGTIEDISERKTMEEQLQKMSIMDELTGLYNRRGFLTLAQQQLKVAERTKKEMFLFFADLDNLKWINDTLGHQEGDHALLDIAAILKETFRESDIIGRMGGDEFAILALDTGEVNPETLTSRLQNCMEGFNQKVTRPFHLSISMGMAHYNPDHPLGIDQLIAVADRLMYEQKRNKTAPPP